MSQTSLRVQFLTIPVFLNLFLACPRPAWLVSIQKGYSSFEFCFGLLATVIFTSAFGLLIVLIMTYLLTCY